MILKLSEVKSNDDRRNIGGNSTLLAIKDHYSYMVGTDKKRLKVIEDRKLIFSGFFAGEQKKLRDMIYVKHSNCYLLWLGDEIFRKDLNDQNLSFLMGIKSMALLKVGSCFRSSELHQRVIIAKDKSKISVLNLESKEIDIEAELHFDNFIRDFQLSGKNEDTVVSLSHDGQVVAKKLDFENKEVEVLDHLQIELIEEKDERGESLTVCDKTQCIFVELLQNKGRFYLQSRLIILELKETKFAIRHRIEEFRICMGENLSLEFFGYIGNHGLMIGMSGKENGVAEVFGYNIETGEFKELKDKRLPHLEKNPAKMIRLGDQFYYTGERGKLMKLHVQV